MSDQSPLRVAVIGVGHLGQHHARIYSSIDDVDLVGVVDIDHERGKEIAEKYDTDFYPDLDDIIDKIDAASIVVPTEDHYEVGRRLINAGIDCLIEKPMVQTLEQAEKLYSLSEDGNVLLQVGHIERFNTAFVTAREYIDDPHYIEVQRMGPFTERSDDIGVVMDLMIHDIDIVFSLINSPVKDLKSIGSSVMTDFEDVANARFEFENGSVANLTASRVSPDARREIRIYQDHNCVSLNLDYKDQKVQMWRLKNGNPRSLDDVEIITPPIESGETLRRELLHFIHCIQEDRDPVVGGVEGMDAIKLAFDVVDVMKMGRKMNGVHG